jgi:hypothetical protein
MRPGNSGRTTLRTGLRRYEVRGVLPTEMRARVDAFRDQVERDRGGRSELSAIEVGYVGRLAQIEAALELLAADIQDRGIVTQRGRPRVAYRLFLDTLNIWDRLAQRVGIERRARHVDPLEGVRRAVAEANQK